LFAGNCSSQELDVSTIISKKHAIEIAKKEGFYSERKNWRIEIDYVTGYESKTNFWFIHSYKDCLFFVNHKYKVICINAQNGSVMYKFFEKDKYWAPPVYR